MMNNAYAFLNTAPRLRAILVWLLIAPTFFMGGCARHHHYLARYDFQGQTLALDAPYAPVPRIITDVEGDVVGGVASRSVGGLFRAATSIAKEAHAEKARRRLDRAADSVDVSMLIAEEALPRAARYMGAIPSEDLDRSDFVMILRIKNHGIYAGRSYDGGMEYFVDARVELIDNHSGRLVWKRDVGVQEPLNDGGFYLFDNVRNAKALSELSEEELRDALERLSRYTADCITRTLANDLR
ncbi:MAG: hypothetical protein R2834_06145 [Rhodothermales bacterium]